MAIRIVVNGAAGRMGRRLVALAAEDKELAVVAGVDSPASPEQGRDIGELAGVGKLGVPLTPVVAVEADALIDFSAPAALAGRLADCRKRKLPIVVGTTGLEPEHHKLIDAAAAEIPVLQSPNMSLGVNLLFQVVSQVAAALGDDYDVEVIEAHHRFKADSPSGTALGLSTAIAKALFRDPVKDLVHGREGQVGARTRKEIGMHAVRAGDIVGDHTVIFGGLGERIEIRHVAQTRDTFVRGALRAAKWLVGRAPGRYDMQQVLGLKPV